VLFNYLLVSPAGPMGRFFFPALSSLAILMFYGLSLLVTADDRPQTTTEMTNDEGDSGRPYELTNEERSKFVTRHSSLVTHSVVDYLALAANLFMLALALVALFGYLAPAYTRPPSFAEGAALPNPVDIQFDSLVKLRGYAVDRETVRPGEPIGIELYWEVTGQPPGDYLLFTHLIDEETGALVAQRDTHPGLGNFPSSQWRPGDRFVERFSLYAPETAYAPGEATLRVGLYAPEGYRLGISDAATGEGLGDSFAIGGVAIEPNAPKGVASLPNPGRYHFEDRIRLLGYEYDRRALAPGDPLTVTLFWEALRDEPGAYDVQVRLLDEAGNIVFAAQRPLPELARDGATTDVHVIPGDLSRPPGSYTVQVSLVDPLSEQRLQLVAEDGRWIDDKLRLSAVRISDG
jgi:hypothetical protein